MNATYGWDGEERTSYRIMLCSTMYWDNNLEGGQYVYRAKVEGKYMSQCVRFRCSRNMKV